MWSLFIAQGISELCFCWILESCSIFKEALLFVVTFIKGRLDFWNCVWTNFVFSYFLNMATLLNIVFVRTKTSNNRHFRRSTFNKAIYFLPSISSTLQIRRGGASIYDVMHISILFLYDYYMSRLSYCDYNIIDPHLPFIIFGRRLTLFM